LSFRLFLASHLAWAEAPFHCLFTPQNASINEISQLTHTLFSICTLSLSLSLYIYIYISSKVFACSFRWLTSYVRYHMLIFLYKKY
jgi:hypothetical protein